MSTTIDGLRKRISRDCSSTTTGLAQAAPRRQAIGPSSNRSKPLSMRKNFVWVAVGNGINALSLWGIVVVLAKIGNTEMIGLYALAFAVCRPLVELTNLGLRGALVTDARRDYAFADYLGLRIISSVVLLVCIATVVLIADYTTGATFLILMVALGKVFEVFSDIFHGFLEQHERMDRVSISLMIRGPLFLAAFALGLYLSGDIHLAMIAFPLVLGATFFCYDLPNGIRTMKTSLGDDAAHAMRPRFDRRTLIRLAWLSLPLGLVMVMIGLTASIPQYLIEFHLGRHALGVFVMVAYASAMAAIVVSAIGRSSSPRLAKYHAAENKAAFCKLLGRMVAVVACLGVLMVAVMAVAGRPLLTLLYDAEIAQHVDLAVWVTAAAAVRYLCRPLGRGIDAMRRFKTHMMIRGIGVLLLLVLLPGFIAAYELKGVAMAMLLGSALSLLLYVTTVLLLLNRAERVLPTVTPSDAVRHARPSLL